MDLHKKYRTLFSKYSVDTLLRIAHFSAQYYHEGGSEAKREGGYYTSVSRLRNIFKTPFKGKSDIFVKQYLKNSIKLLSYVYANRMGNGNEASGDGFKYRGGGGFQNTGKNQYQKLQEDTGIALLSDPELINEEANSIVCALEYWKNNNLNKYADLDDLDSVSDIINIGRCTDQEGDANGYKDRQDKLIEWKLKLKI